MVEGDRLSGGAGGVSDFELLYCGEWVDVVLFGGELGGKSRGRWCG